MQVLLDQQLRLQGQNITGNKHSTIHLDIEQHKNNL